MQELITKSTVKVIGISWNNYLVAAEFDIDNIDFLRDSDGSLHRNSVEHNILQRTSCDFMMIYDSYADLFLDSIRQDKVINWQNTNSEQVFFNLLYSIEEKMKHEDILHF